MKKVSRYVILVLLVTQRFSGLWAMDEGASSVQRVQDVQQLEGEITVILKDEEKCFLSGKQWELLKSASGTISDLLGDMPQGAETEDSPIYLPISRKLFDVLIKCLEGINSETLDLKEYLQNNEYNDFNLSELIGVASFFNMPKLLYTLVEISIDLLIREISKFGKSECFDQLSIIVNEYEQLPIEITRLISKKLIAAMTKLALPDNELKKKIIDILLGKKQYSNVAGIHSDLSKVFFKYVDRLDLLDLSSGNVTQYQGAIAVFSWSPDSTKIFLEYDDHFDLLDLSSGNVTQYQEVTKVFSWSSDSTKVFLEYDDRFDLLDLSSGNADVIQYPGATAFFSWSPDSTKVFLEYDDRFDLLDLSSGNAIVAPYQGAKGVFAWSPDSTKFFLKYVDHVDLIDLSSGNVIVTSYQGVTKVFSWSPDSTKVFLKYVDRLDLIDLSLGNASVTKYKGATNFFAWSSDSTKFFLEYKDRDELIDFFNRPDLSIFQVLFLIWIIQEDAGIKNLPKYLGDLFNDLPEKIKEEITPGIQEELSGFEFEEEEQPGKRGKTGKEEE